MRTPAELVNFIRTMCKKRHTSLTKLEEKFAWANGTIGKWAKGTKYPPHDKLQKIAEELSVSVEYLLGTEFEDDYSAKLRKFLLPILTALDPCDLGDESIGDYLKIRNWAEISRPLSFAEACEAANFAGISLDSLEDRSLPTKKGPPSEEGGLNEREQELIRLFRELNREGQEQLVDTADTMVSSGKYKKSGSTELGKAQGA